MKLCLTSDLHGQLPKTLPEADILLVAGDICPNFDNDPKKDADLQEKWLETVFLDWLKTQPVKYCIGIWGNHDFVGEKLGNFISSRFAIHGTQNYLEYKGIKFGFNPYCLTVGDWAFGLDEVNLKKWLDNIPKVDILLSHSPAKNLGDAYNWGSIALRHYIEEKKPKVVLCGHVHEAYGIYKYEDTTLLNACYLNDHYKPANDVIMLNMETSFSVQLP